MGVKVAGLEVNHGARRAVDGVSFEVRSGEIFGLIGVNGAGKSTTLAAVVGLQPVGAGVIEVCGVDVTRRPDEARLLLGYVPQQVALFGGLTVAENLEIFGGIYHLDRAARRRQSAWALEVAQLADRRGERIERLSGGMQRRLNLVCALLHDPAVLVCDEPTVGVDPDSRAHLIQTLRGLARAGKAVLYTAHHMDEVEALCSHVGVLHHGKLLAMGETAQVLAAGAPGVSATLEVELEGGDSAASSEEVAAVAAALRAAGIGVRSVRRPPQRLEAVFMGLIGRAGQER